MGASLAGAVTGLCLVERCNRRRDALGRDAVQKAMIPFTALFLKRSRLESLAQEYGRDAPWLNQ